MNPRQTWSTGQQKDASPKKLSFNSLSHSEHSKMCFNCLFQLLAPGKSWQIHSKIRDRGCHQQIRVLVKTQKSLLPSGRMETAQFPCPLLLQKLNTLKLSDNSFCQWHHCLDMTTTQQTTICNIIYFKELELSLRKYCPLWCSPQNMWNLNRSNLIANKISRLHRQL